MWCGVRVGEDSIGIRLDTDSANGCAVPTPGIRVLNSRFLPVGSRHFDSASGLTYGKGELQLFYSCPTLFGNGGQEGDQ